MDWYTVKNEQELDSPALLIYKERVSQNIDTMITQVEDVSQLIPHIKTNKMREVISLLKNKGINQVKTATIAEAELAAQVGIKHILIAHQLVGPKQNRFISLIKHFPELEFSTIVDDKIVINQLSEKAKNAGIHISLYLDVNSGMNRSGFQLNQGILSFYSELCQTPHVNCKGLHVYDGHHGKADYSARSEDIKSGFSKVEELVNSIKASKLPTPQIIAGGSPAFSTHNQFQDRLVSPGTVLLWDWGYAKKCHEQEYEYAGLVFTRVISKPAQGIITVDMGHKAVASENPIENRIRFLNLKDYTLKSQSEEHGVIVTKNWDNIQVGDGLYGVPYHICPTVNLYHEAHVISEQTFTKTWSIEGRDRKITI